MKFECPQHADKQTHAHTHNTLDNKVIWEPWRSNIQICQREKNDNSIESQSWGVLWLWLFIWSRAVQSASEWTQISISFRIWKHLQASNHFSSLSLHNTHSLALSQLLSPSSCSSTLVSFAFYRLLIFFRDGSSGEKSLPLVFLDSCLHGSLLELVFTRKQRPKQISISQESAVWIFSFVNTAAERAMDGGCKRSEVSPSVHHTYGLQKMVPILVVSVTLKSFINIVFSKSRCPVTQFYRFGDRQHIWIFWIKS